MLQMSIFGRKRERPFETLSNHSFKRYSKEKLIIEIKRFCHNYEAGISTQEIVNWRDECHRNVSIYALNPMYKCFYFKPAPDFKHDNIRLCYVTQDHHLYPILNEEAIEKITY